MKFSTLLLSSAIFAGSASAADLSAVPSGKYFVDPTHAYVNFQYNHLGLSNPVLQFDEFKIAMDLDTAEPTNTKVNVEIVTCLLYTSPSPRDATLSRMPSSA